MKFISRLCVIGAAIVTVAMPFRTEAKEYNIVGKLKNGDEIRVVLNTIVPQKNYPYRLAYQWGGWEVSPPKNIIEKLSVRVGCMEIQVPLSAYSDLADVQQVKLVNSKQGIKLIIIGGDASGSYMAVLEFDREVILSRRVDSGEFPNEVYEKTVYSWIPDDGR